MYMFYYKDDYGNWLLDCTKNVQQFIVILEDFFTLSWYQLLKKGELFAMNN